MATAATSPNDLTRQQLDELDSLLQRMLSLPLTPPESHTPAPAAPPYTPPLPYSPPAAPAPIPAAREVSAPVPAPRVFTPPVPDPVELPTPWKSILEPAQQPEPAPVIERAVPAPVPVAKPVSPAPVPVTLAAPAPIATQSESVPFLLAPLVGFNAVLNWFLGQFGLPGRILRSGFIKSLFGLAGFGLLVYTGLKVAQIHGWISLPEQLPWPR